MCFNSTIRPHFYAPSVSDSKSDSQKKNNENLRFASASDLPDIFLTFKYYPISLNSNVGRCSLLLAGMVAENHNNDNNNKPLLSIRPFQRQDKAQGQERVSIGRTVRPCDSYGGK